MPAERALYDALELQPTATAEEIKRAYRRLALRYHPDKNPADGGERFRVISTAFEVLGDENLRSVYDRYGQMGVDMARQFGGDSSMAAMFVSQGESLLVTSFCLISILIAIISLFPIFVALKADGKVDWSWSVVFIPVWLFDFCGYAFILSRYFLWAGAAAEAEAEASADGDDEELPEEQRRQRREQQKSVLLARSRLLGAKRLVQWSALFLFQLFIVLKLDSTVGWSWAGVFIPWFVLELFPLLTNGITFLITLSVPSDTAGSALINWKQKLQLFILIFRQWLLRIIFAVLVVCRADEVITTSWAVVFIPVYLVFVDWILSELVDYRLVSAQLSAGGDAVPEDKQAAIRSVKLFKIIGIIVITLLSLVVLGMFIVRLNSPVPTDSYSVGTILIPVFLVLGLSFCCCCCCLPCLVIVGSANEIDVENNPPLPLETKRIEYGTVANKEGSSSNNTAAVPDSTTVPQLKTSK